MNEKTIKDNNEKIMAQAEENAALVYSVSANAAYSEAKAAADMVTVSNEEHAIARIIYDVEEGRLAV